MAHILFVDDDRGLQALVEELLQSEGHTVSCAVDGYQALTSVVQKRPDLIVTDYLMPPPDGFRLLQMLASQGIHIPSILLTGHAPGRLHPADALVEKPFDIDTLLETINRLLLV